MKDENKTKKQLIHELSKVRKRMAELEASGNGYMVKGNNLIGDERSHWTICNELSVGLELYDSEGRLLDANKSSLDMFGVLDVVELKDLELFRNFSISDESREKLCNGERVEYAASFDFDCAKRDHILKTAKTGTINIDIIITPIEMKEKGLSRKYLVQVQDITERKQAQDRLKLLREAVESLPIGITISDLDGKIIYMNFAEAETHGYAEAELIGKDARMLAPNEMWEPVAFDELHAMGVRKRESLNIRKDGTIFPVQLISRAVKNELGGRIGIITACEDVSDRKQADEKLKQREEALHSVYKMATTLGRSFSSVCDEVVVNLSRLLGVSHVFVLCREHGKVKFISGIADNNLQSVEEMTCPENCLCASVYDTKEVSQIQGPLKNSCPDHPFAKDDIISLYCVPVKDTAYNVVGSINLMSRKSLTFTYDETHLIEIFARYIAFMIEKEAMDEKLRSAQKMELVGKLAGGVAHEVRNPLNAIMTISQALSRELGENPEYRPFLEHIRSQVDRLSVLMRDLLDLGKPGDQFLFQREYLNEICSASIDIWSNSHSGRLHTARLVEPLRNGDIAVHADSRRLQQAFINLLENASQHTPENGEIEVVVQKTQRGMCSVSVVDRGSGIPGAFLPRIFEPFFSMRKGGTGLGMNIVRHIVETHGGTVEIMNNDPLPGCTVVVQLPVAEKEA